MFPERTCDCDAAKKAEYGCDGGAALPQVILGELDDTCPRRPILDDPMTFVMLFNAYAHYSNGFLMEEGSVMDQPDKLMKMLAIISSQVVDCQNEKQQVEGERRAAQRRRDAEAKQRGGRHVERV